MTRFDIPNPVKNLLTTAIRLEILDAADAFALGATHGSNWRELMNEIMDAAFANRHGPLGRKKHAEICVAHDLACAALGAA